MRVSELVERSGVPLASVKFYLREGLLMPGRSTAARQADYGEEHLRRLRIIRALTGAVGLSVQKTREVLAIVDSAPPARAAGEVFDALGQAIAALPPYAAELADYPRARAVLERLGQVYDPRFAAVAQLERALEAAEDAGLPISEDRIDAYGEALHRLAEFDLAQMPAEDPSAALEYAVLGTALYEPVILALRRLAHQDVAARSLGLGEASTPQK
ncbi:MerR family transcriptional regulator [Rathayibacter sp. YIM 133350]|uniref:MerR family transcriptional regulator n=1 Tax=Rathayibacter sp. YIM 133350 TaxID=3131992 RepID=UPI00307F1F28